MHECRSWFSLPQQQWKNEILHHQKLQKKSDWNPMAKHPAQYLKPCNGTWPLACLEPSWRISYELRKSILEQKLHCVLCFLCCYNVFNDCIFLRSKERPTICCPPIPHRLHLKSITVFFCYAWNKLLSSQTPERALALKP